MGKLKQHEGESDEAYIARVREYHRTWREQNRERVREADRRYREAHPSLLQARRAAAWMENRDAKLEKQRAWQERNKDKVRGYSRKYEASHPNRKSPEAAKAYSRKKYANNLEAERQRAREKSTARVAAGVCRSCTSPPAFGSQVCETHWFAHRATQRLGLGPDSIGRGQALKAILEAQNYTCPYSGRKLVPGVNAAVDHIRPHAHHPELRGELSNIQWVDEVVNRMKQDLEHKDFIALCALIAKRTG